jgi:predicted  nucleic acid-binding Zn-ribbon protein
MDTTSNTTTPGFNKKTRSRRNLKETTKVTTEREDLNVHVDICQLRYQQLEERIARVESTVGAINKDLQDFKHEVRENFDDIKTLLGAAKDQKFNAIVGAASAVIVALLGMMGYIITHLPK